MSIYKIISTNQQILADEAFCERCYPGDWAYVGEQPGEAVPARRIVRDWEFRNRFSQAQLVGIMRAAMGGDDNAAVVWLRLSTASDGVDLDDPDNVAGVQYVAATYPALGIDPVVMLA